MDKPVIFIFMRKAYFYKLVIRAGQKKKGKKAKTVLILKQHLSNTNSHINKRLKQVWLKIFSLNNDEFLIVHNDHGIGGC